MSKLNVAQIGIGYWGPNILRNLAASSRCTVKSVADFAEERREFARRLYPGIQAVAEPGEIIGDPVSTPS